MSLLLTLNSMVPMIRPMSRGSLTEHTATGMSPESASASASKDRHTSMFWSHMVFAPLSERSVTLLILLRLLKRMFLISAGMYRIWEAVPRLFSRRRLMYSASLRAWNRTARSSMSLSLP